VSIGVPYASAAPLLPLPPLPPLLSRSGGGESYAWSDMVEATVGNNGALAVKSGGALYELAVKAELMPGRFHHVTKVSCLIACFVL
jgi:hypothetical protein